MVGHCNFKKSKVQGLVHKWNGKSWLLVVLKHVLDTEYPVGVLPYMGYIGMCTPKGYEF